MVYLLTCKAGAPRSPIDSILPAAKMMESKDDDPIAVIGKIQSIFCPQVTITNSAYTSQAWDAAFLAVPTAQRPCGPCCQRVDLHGQTRCLRIASI